VVRRFLPQLALLAAVAACASHRGDGEAPRPPAEAGGSGGTPAVPCSNDDDHDGVLSALCGGLDCDDHDPAVHPGAPEVCGDGVDQDCDGTPDGGCVCDAGARRGCWTGAASARDVGECHDGWQLCGARGTWGPCVDQRMPAVEAGCDGQDDDCDGSDGPHCQACPPGAREICANGLDDDCNGVIDDPSVCSFTCRGRDPVVDADALCCFAPPQNLHSTVCAEEPGLLPSCDSPERRCLDLDDDPATRCTKACSHGTCTCGEPTGDGLPRAAAHCGFETPCLYRDCDDRENQPCYSGPPATLGIGVCHGGRATCTAGGDGTRSWGACEGEVLPGVEICGNGLDDDCDGRIDEADGATGKHCKPERDCLGREVCGNGLDDDCNGFVDEGCPAAGEQICSSAPEGAVGVGMCRAGTQVAEESGWGLCLGEVTPSPEICGDAQDSDCNGRGGPGEPEDAGCCTPTGIEVCNGVDDDCDGLVDERVMSRCGRCDDTPCEVEDWSAGLADCKRPGRSCEQVRSAPGGGITLDPSDGLTPSSEIVLPFVGDVLQLDADTGKTVRSVVQSTPQPFAAALALDGSLWTVEANLLVHRDAQGRGLCTRELLVPLGVALDPSGDVWVVLAAGTLIRIDANAVSVTQPDGTPWPDFKVHCDVHDLTPDDPSSFGLWLHTQYQDVTVGGDGLLWLIAPGEVMRLDMGTLETQVITTSSQASTGVADIEGNLWLEGDPLTRIDASGPYEIVSGVRRYETRYPGVALTTPLIASDGALWGGAGSQLVRFDPISGFVDRYEAPTRDPITYFAMDEFDRIFASAEASNPQRGAYWRFDGSSWSKWFQDPFYVPAPFYSPGGLSRAMLRRISGTRGTWSQIVDGQVVTARFERLTWSADVPEGASAKVSVRLSRTRSGLATTEVICGPEQDGEIDITACTGGAFHRFAQVDVVLYTLPGREAPVVRNLKLEWTRP
jgi:hypothetical protein